MSFARALKSLARALRCSQRLHRPNALARACGYDIEPPTPRPAYVEPTYLAPWVAGGPSMFVSGPGCHHLGDEGRSADVSPLCIDCHDFLTECEGYAVCAVCRAHLLDESGPVPFRWRWVESNTVQCICEACADSATLVRVG